MSERSSDPAVPAGLDSSRGRYANRPTEIPWRGIKDVLWRVWREIVDDDVAMIASSTAFWCLLSLFPAMIAVVSLYGLVFDPQDVLRQARELSPFVPPGGRRVMLEQLSEIVAAPKGNLGVGLLISAFVLLISASSGVHALIEGINRSYDQPETRSYLQIRLLAVKFTIGVLVLMAAGIALVAIVPVLLDGVGLSAAAQRVLSWARWPVLALGVMALLSSMYRYAPNRARARWRWINWGSVAATLVWVLASLGLSFYAASFGKYNETYGTLGGVIVLMLWLFVSSLAILIGAELNAELERQTAVDSTTGPPRPMGQRRAFVADTLGPTREDVAQ